MDLRCSVADADWQYITDIYCQGLGKLPFAQSTGQLLFHLISNLYERSSVIITTNWPSADGRAPLATPR
jgi:hypothetical protein